MAGFHDRTHPHLETERGNRFLASFRNFPYLSLLLLTLMLGTRFAGAKPAIPISRPDLNPQNLTPTEKRLDKLRKDWLITEVEAEDEGAVQKKLDELQKRTTENAITSWVIPGTSLMTPTAFGADWTSVYFGFGVQNRSRFSPKTKLDAAWTGGLGFFDARKYVGLEVDYSDYDVDNPFNAGGVGLKLHHTFSRLELAVAVGWINAIIINQPDDGSSYYTVFSRYFLLRADPTKAFSMLFFHLGVGNGRFMLERDIIARRDAWALFGSVAIRVLKPVNLIANWTGSDLATGVSVAPFRRFPLIFTFSALDVVGTAGDGIRYVLSMGYGDSVTSDTFPIGIFKK